MKGTLLISSLCFFYLGSVLSKEGGKYSILSNQLRPSLLMPVKARALLPKPLVLPRITGIDYYPWITTFEAHTTEIIGDDALNGDIIGYDTFELDTGTINCSSILKKRKHKMNKHKYKKRRKRDKFKRRNLENIKERKQKAREKADERAKQAAG